MRKVLKMGRYLHFEIWLVYTELLLATLIMQTDNAIMAPPWANATINPCAALPAGWQLLFWPQDGKCYKIFQMGYPCPDDMELTPVTSKLDGSFKPECRCPPKHYQHPNDGRCYELFTLGPCEIGHYFAPESKTSKRQLGKCKQLTMCANRSQIYWPKDGKCYTILTRGPCARGQLLFVDSRTSIPICTCAEKTELQAYKHENGYCYQHYTKGPCLEKGHLFLPNKTCGCHNELPHFHEESRQCYELETRGPCGAGQIFHMNSHTRKAQCICKPNYISYRGSSTCYRVYTRGPCLENQIFINSTTCIDQPCQRGQLYYPQNGNCYRIGSRGPCPEGKIFGFNFETKPGIDGISYDGICSCKERNCVMTCDRTKGMIEYEGKCHKMYTKGPCQAGSWLVPKREGKQEEIYNNDEIKQKHMGICECIPGYVKTIKTIGHNNVTVCLSPAMLAADYATREYTKVS